MSDYNRKPIILNEHCVALVSLYTRTDYLEDCWSYGIVDPAETQIAAAKQLIAQLEGQWSPRFMIALRDAATERLAEHDTKYGTKFAV